MTPVPEAVLDVQGLRTEFEVGGEVYKAVGGVDLALRQGECLGLVGESGSGKSVTAMSIMGLVPTPPGRIAGGVALLEGEDLFAASDERIRQLRGATVSHVFQDPLSTLHPLFTVGDAARSRRSGRTRRSATATRRRGRPSCSRSSASPTRPSGSRPIRTSSRAACASGSASPWRWPTTPR